MLLAPPPPGLRAALLPRPFLYPSQRKGMDALAADLDGNACTTSECRFGNCLQNVLVTDGTTVWGGEGCCVSRPPARLCSPCAAESQRRVLPVVVLQCNDGNTRTDNDACRAGVCTGVDLCVANSVTCNQPPSPCHEALGTCFRGNCSYQLRQPGAACTFPDTPTGACAADGRCLATRALL